MSSEVTTPRLHDWLVDPSLRVLDRGIKEFFEGASPPDRIFQAYVKHLINSHNPFRADARKRLDEVAKTYTPPPQLSPSEKLAAQYHHMKQVAIELKTHYLGFSDRSPRLNDLWLTQLLFKPYGEHRYSSEDRKRFRAEILSFTDYELMKRGLQSQGGGMHRTPSGTFSELAMKYFRSNAEDPHSRILVSISDVLAAIALCRGTVKKIAPETIKPPTPRLPTTPLEPHRSSSAISLGVVPPLPLTNEPPKDTIPSPLSPTIKEELSSYVKRMMKDVAKKVRVLAAQLEEQQVQLWGKVSPHLSEQLPKHHPSDQVIAPEKMFALMMKKELDASVIPMMLVRVQICKDKISEQKAKKHFVSQCIQLFRYYKLRRELHVFWELLHPKKR